MVINGLRQASGNNLNLETASIQFVMSNLNQVLGYSYVEGGKSSVTASALLMKSIDEISNDPQHKIGLADYIVSQKLPDNSYGGNGIGTPHETAVAIIALESLNDNTYQTPIDFAKTALNAMQSVDGSMQGSVYSTALAINVFNTNTKANLKFNYVQVSNNNVVAGEQIFVNIELLNSGVVDANNIEVSLYKEAIDNANIIGQLVMPLLSPNQVQIEQFLIDTSGFNVNTKVIVVIDVNNNISENNEEDNVFTFTLNVLQPSSEPELAFNTGAFIISPDQFDALPFTFTANATVVNLSLSDSDNVTLSLYKLETNNDLTLLASATENINALASHEFIFNVEITQANLDIPLVFKIDPENSISEVNEDNNTYSTLINKIQSIDIAIATQDVSLPSQAIIGKSQNIAFNFHNNGTELSSSFDVKVYAELDSTSLLIFESQISEMAAGEQINRMFDWTPLTEGDYSIRFVIDESNQLAETNETNNEITLPLQVIANALSNILIEDSDVTMSPNPGLQGQDLQFSLTIHNNSSTGSGDFDATIYQQMATGIPNRVIASKTNITSIVANSSAVVLIDILATNLKYDHTFIFEIDSSQTITEFNEDDNIVIKDFTVLSKPDAFISAGSFQLTPSIP
ncbi:hypothetical protein MNBD_GAMMA01-2035, partial [hydrothermal vent metagenome]